MSMAYEWKQEQRKEAIKALQIAKEQEKQKQLKTK